jgi:hypothetical protein
MYIYSICLTIIRIVHLLLDSFPIILTYVPFLVGVMIIIKRILEASLTHSDREVLKRPRTASV